jgi:uncharacterized protein
MLRARLSEALKVAMKAHEARAVSTLRMVLSTLKNRDIAARDKGNTSGIDDAEIASMLQGMIKQRRESIALYEQGNRPELARQEAEEIAVIEGFLPKQLSDSELDEAVKAAIAASGAAGPKDMGRVMASLREKHAGQMDFAKASAAAKKLLG